MREFKEIYPMGLNSTIANFQQSMHKVMMTEEIDRIINTTKGSEQRWLKKFKKEYRKAFGDRKWYAAHWIPVLHTIKSTELLKDVICEMVSNGIDKTYTGEDAEDDKYNF